MQSQQQLFKSLFKRDITDPESQGFLRELVARHPYFSPAQFYLLRQSEPGTASFEKQAGLTNLFFTNPLWLNLQLLEADETVVFPEKIDTVPFSTQPVEVETTPEIPNPVTESVAVDTLPGIPEETIPVTGETTTSAEPISAQSPVHSAPEEEPAIPTTRTQPEEQPATETTVTETAAMSNTDNIHTEENKLPEELPLFEPMHMVDYFASQGIKLSEEIQTADKLGKQLKSFTEWLKTMKKVHAGSEQAAGASDKTVEDLAEKSNVGNEVITEAMAEVFARQGKRAKATEVYQKLSLLNPAKSAYFAAKIENLKDA
ncbi:MAG TPA: hypothetical protein PKA94_02160 [Ferruginibacter sp.]|nr:hypothetical protein [Ferruginibacter sp.]